MGCWHAVSKQTIPVPQAVCNDELQMVLDWPICAPLCGGLDTLHTSLCGAAHTRCSLLIMPGRGAVHQITS